MMSHPSTKPAIHGFQPTDPMVSKIDHLAEVCQLWKERRQKHMQTNSLRASVVVLCEEIADLARAHPEPSRKP